MKIVLQHLTKKFPARGPVRGRKNREDVIAVNDFDFEIPDGKLIGLLGPSGCGKSTALNLICGLLKPTEGKIFFGEDDVTGLPPENRGVGMVFQNYALYPHLTVEKNIQFPLENLKGADKLSKEESSKLSKWLDDERNIPDRGYGLIARTNAADASKEEFFHELEMLKKQYEKVAVHGRNRTCYSLLYEAEPFYLAAVRDVYTRDLDEIVTDIPEIHEKIFAYLSEFQPDKLEILKLYQDKLLPLYKLYSLEGAIDEVCHEKIWLKSGGFLVIQQTEAFVSIDVNSGKYTGKKKAEETYRKINLEAAAEIARQIRLRNLSGIILVDFINMENPDHQDELFHVLQKYLRKDPVKCKAIDITPLHILEMTRQKVRRPLIEDLRELSAK